MYRRRGQDVTSDIGENTPIRDSEGKQEPISFLPLPTSKVSSDGSLP